MINKKGPIPKIEGYFIPILELYTRDMRRKRDCDNRLKAPLDWAVRIGLVEDDSFAKLAIAGWVEEEQAPHGAKLTLYPYKKEGLPEVAAALVAKFGSR